MRKKKLLRAIGWTAIGVCLLSSILEMVSMDDIIGKTFKLMLFILIGAVSIFFVTNEKYF